MDADRFDAFVRSLRAVPRRTTIGALLGAGLSALTTAGSTSKIAAKKRRRKKKNKKNKKKGCPAGTKTCRGQCILPSVCCTNDDCGENQRCAGGGCESCLPQGTDCTDDDQCCTGICDTYTNKCQQVRVNCESDLDCPNGRCCEIYEQCVYETATQLACVPDGEPNASCGYVVCARSCEELTSGDYEYCGFEGSAACRNGRCCCPAPISLEDCPDLTTSGGFLPRCP
jgi:hypothetical protein